MGTALLAFVLLAPRPAQSAARNIAGAGCQLSGGAYFCPVMVEGTTWTVSAFGGAFFDFQCSGGVLSEYDLNKYSFTGSFYQDTGTHSCPVTTNQEQFTTATNVKTNASVYDYMWVSVFGVTSLYGVEARFN
jgi:hypothetical protein